MRLAFRFIFLSQQMLIDLFSVLFTILLLLFPGQIMMNFVHDVGL